jgi:hypothetical protein
MQPLGRNLGGYRGEQLDLDGVLRACRVAAAERGWDMESFSGVSPSGLVAFRRLGPSGSPSRPRPRIYISAGIHGDEPAGPSAIQELLCSDLLPRDCDYWVCPCLNPAGFAQNTRTNPEGVDLNRDYRGPVSREVRDHIRWLERQPSFDLTLCLHEDWESRGFYLYELNPDGHPTLAESMIDAVRPVCPIDLAQEIEGRPSVGGVIRPALTPALRPDWPEALYLLQHKTRLSYTLESPSDFALDTRVRALVAAVNSALLVFACRNRGGVLQ